MLRLPLQVLKLIALLLRPQQSPTIAHLLHLFLYLFVHLFLPPCLQVALTVSLLQKTTKKCVPSAGADVVAPLGTSTVPPLWLEQGHALRIIDELKKRRRGGRSARVAKFRHEWAQNGAKIAHRKLQAVAVH